MRELDQAKVERYKRVIEREWVGREDLAQLLYPSRAEREWDAKLIDPQTELEKLSRIVLASEPDIEEEKGVPEREEEEKKRKEEEEKKKQGGQQPGQPGHQPPGGGEQKPGGGQRY